MPSASNTSGTSLPNLVSRVLLSVDEVVSLARAPDIITLSQFASLVEKLVPVLRSLEKRPLSSSDDDSELRDALESLDEKLGGLRGASGSTGSPPMAQLFEVYARDLARCLGVLMLAYEDAPVEARQRISALHREMMAAEFDSPPPPQLSPPPSPPPPSPPLVRPSMFGGMDEPDFEDVVLRVKTVEEGDELLAALEELGSMIEEGLAGEKGGIVVPVLLNRLGSAKDGNRSKIVLLLRRLASLNEENKESMADIVALSTIVRSLTRDIDESREAVGLLLDLSEIPRVRQRLGRVQGCIVMLVILLNREDPSASHDAGKLLHALSSNTQNVLLMAEAGYFVPMVHYLKQGSEMSKILMASAISRMKLTNQTKAGLGREGSIEPLVDMFTSAKLEAKLSSLGALRNLSTPKENVHLLIKSGIVAPLLQLLFSVTSVLVTLKEPAAAILACVAQSELILADKDIAQQMLSLLDLSNPVIQCHLLCALNSIVIHPKASKVRLKMKRNGAVQLILPFLTESNCEIRQAALSLLLTVSKDLEGELTEQVGDTHLNVLVEMISSSNSEDEKAAAAGILCNIPLNDKKATEILKGLNLLPILVSLLSACTTASSTAANKLLENIAGLIVRFTVSWDKKLQRESVELGIIPLLVKLLSNGSPIARSRAATSLAQLSQNTLSLSKTKVSRWMCVPPSSDAFCEVHNYNCTVKSTFCIVKACAISPLVQILEGKDREADEAVLGALATLMQDDICENGTNALDKASGVEALIRILEIGSLQAQERALWMLERIFRIENQREKYGKAAQILLIALAQKGNPTLKPMVAKILAHLEFLQMQSIYFC